MIVSVRLFARLKERVGATQIDIDVQEPATVSTLLRVIYSQYPVLQQHSSSLLVSINQEFADDSHPIAEGDEIALFPPVSGG